MTFTAIYNSAFVYDRPGLPAGGRATPVHVDFGDGTSHRRHRRQAHALHPRLRARHLHRALQRDRRPGQPGDVAARRHRLRHAARRRSRSTATTFTAHVDGGDGRPLSYEWTFGDGDGAARPERSSTTGTDRVTLRVVDGTTTVATTSIGLGLALAPARSDRLALGEAVGAAQLGLALAAELVRRSRRSAAARRPAGRRRRGRPSSGRRCWCGASRPCGRSRPSPGRRSPSTCARRR